MTRLSLNSSSKGPKTSPGVSLRRPGISWYSSGRQKRTRPSWNVIGNIHRCITAMETLADNWVLDRNEVAAILNNRAEYAAMWAAGTPQPALSVGPDPSQLPTSLPIRDSSSSSLPQLEAQASSPEDVNADRARPIAPEARGYSPTPAELPAVTSSPANVPTVGVPAGAPTAVPALNGGSESSTWGHRPQRRCHPRIHLHERHQSRILMQRWSCTCWRGRSQHGVFFGPGTLSINRERMAWDTAHRRSNIE